MSWKTAPTDKVIIAVVNGSLPPTQCIWNPTYRMWAFVKIDDHVHDNGERDPSFDTNYCYVDEIEAWMPMPSEINENPVTHLQDKKIKQVAGTKVLKNSVVIERDGKIGVVCGLGNVRWVE